MFPEFRFYGFVETSQAAVGIPVDKKVMNIVKVSSGDRAVNFMAIHHCH